MRRLPAPCVIALSLTVAALLAQGDGRCLAATAASAKASPAKLGFNEQIQPILSENCYACHGPDPGSRKAGLRLDRVETAFKPLEKGGPAIVKGKPDESPLIKRIESKDPKEIMPPPEAHKTLKPAEIALLRRWIAEGAEYQEHWAFITPKRPALPAVAAMKKVPAPTNPVDRFIMARLQKEKLTPSPEADRSTLIRRVTYDLTGLPPTPEEVDAFLKDAAPGAYDRVVDRLLASPRYGEHRARYWLDYVRYADTHGIHFDNYRAIWPYRDYVIKAFNQNKPFDRFVREQLAGDLLPARTIDDLAATGFVRCNLTTNEGGTIPEETYVNQIRDRVEAFGVSFLGLTTGCAACHDHKFDPFSQRDFYGLAAFLGNTVEKPWDLNIAEPPPVLRLPKEENRPAAEAVLARRADIQAKLDARHAQETDLIAKWLAAGNKPKPVATTGLELRLKLDETNSDVVKNSAPDAKLKEFKADTNSLVWGESSWLWSSARMEIFTRLNLGDLGNVDSGDKFSGGGWLMLRAKPGGGVRTGTGSGTLFSRMGDAKRKGGAGWEIYQEGNQFTVNLVAAEEPAPAPMAAADKPLDATLAQVAATAAGAATQPVTVEAPKPVVAAAEPNVGAVAATAAEPKAGTPDAVVAVDTATIRVVETATTGAEAKNPAKPPAATKKAPAKAMAAKVAPAGPAKHMISVTTKATFSRDEWLHVFFTYDGSRKAAGVKLYINGKLVETDVKSDTLAAKDSLRTDAAMHLGRRDDFNPMRETRYQDVRFYKRALTADEVSRLPFEDVAAEIVRRQPDPKKWTTDETFVAADRYFLGEVDAETKELASAVAAHDVAFDALTKDGMPTLIALEKPTPAYADILKRGDYYSRVERVGPSTPHFLPKLPAGVTPNRKALADWLLSAEQPLLPRVAVNRMWQEVFGRGLVESAGDFGIMGDRPSHPELLDWLAVELRESGWDVKQLYRLLVTSATYRQSSKVTPEQLAKDPANRLLARGPRFRMDGEMLRDSALATSGLLVEKIGGPSVKPYQPPGLWQEVAMPESNTKNYVPDKGEGLYRRSVYTFWKRASMPPSMETFDATSREVVCTRRARTNTPLQAFVTMNDPQWFEAARKLAERALHAAPGADARLDFLARTTLSRPLVAREKTILTKSAEKFRVQFAADAAAAKEVLTVGDSPADAALDPAELAQWTMVASQFLNLDEFLTK